MRKELLYVAATMALVIGLGAGTPNWKGVSVRTDLPGNTSSVSSITFAGGVTAASFQATSTAAGYGTSNGWFIRTVPNGDWALDGAGGTHLQMSVGSGPKLLKPMAADASAIATRSYVDGATNGLASQETNWWAVFQIEDPAASGIEQWPRWTDITLKGWTNAPYHMDGSSPVFAYTTADPALNGTPAWERFTTNWYPRAFYCQTHVSHDITWLAMWRNIKPTYAGSIKSAVEAWDPNTDASYPYRWMIVVRDTNAWFHPTNGLAWAYVLQNDTAVPTVKAMDNSTVLSGGVWHRIQPMWVTYDPRPRIFNEFDNTSQNTITITTPHQKP